MRGLATCIAWTAFACFARADDTRLVTTVDGATPLGGQICDMSSDGRYVLFMSSSSSYVDGDTNEKYDLFVRDMEAGTVERINVATDGTQDDRSGAFQEPIQGTISADGRFVAFTTRGQLDAADDTALDVYLRDRATATTTLVSHSSGTTSWRNSYDAHISRDGNFVVFVSTLSDLVPGDTNTYADVFEWDRVNDTFTCASTDSDGNFMPFNSFDQPRVSGDGRTVVFYRTRMHSDYSTGLGYQLKDLDTGTLEWLFIGYVRALSQDGQTILVTTTASSDPADTNDTADGYVYDRRTGTLECVTFGTGKRSLASYADVAAMSDDGRRFLFTCADDATGGGEGGLEDVYVYDLDTQVALRVSVGNEGERSSRDCVAGQLSGDGHIANFGTASDALWPGDAGTTKDVFVRNLSAIPAAWTNYGSGFDGRFGVPSLALSAPPRRTTTVDLEVGNSSGLYTAGVLFIGLASASLPTTLGGTLLVDPLTTAMLPLTPYDDGFPVRVPDGGDLPGVHVYLQVLELDPWAPKGVSFTPGLDLTIGD